MARGGFRVGAGKLRGDGWRERQKQKRAIKNAEPKTCVMCGTIYIGKRPKYCSLECCLLNSRKLSFKRHRSMMPEVKRAYREKEKHARNERARHRLRTDSAYSLNKRMGFLMRNSLRTAKGGKSWQKLAGYSVDDLRKHLEKQFTDGMTWDVFLSGKIHIDHKIPIAAFNYSCPEHPDFKRCWALKNLQPLWALDNLRKKDKIDKQFQPLLALKTFGDKKS